MQTDLENRAYADLLKHLWESGFFQDGYSSGRECAESVLTGFLDETQLERLLDEYFPQTVLPGWVLDSSKGELTGKRPFKSGWYLVVAKRANTRFVTPCYYQKGSGWYMSHTCEPCEAYDKYVISWQTLPPVPED